MRKHFGKKSLVFLLTLIILSLATIAIIYAASYTDNKEGITWSYEVISESDGTVKITGANISRQTKELVIPQEIKSGDKTYTVIEIGNNVFKDKKVAFGKVTIPEGIVSIGKSAFEGSYITDEVKIPNTVTSIGESAFKNCDGITSVVLPKGVTVLNNSTFEGCYALNSINTENIVTFGNYVFSECKALRNIVFGPNVESIGESTFNNCDSFEGHIDLSQFNSIKDSAFSSCDRITSVTVPNEAHSFTIYSTCPNIEAFEVSDKNQIYTSIDGVLYSKDMTTICAYPRNKKDATYVVDPKVTTIGKRCFLEAQNLDNVVLSESITTIMPEAFTASSIKNAYIPDNVETLSVDTFKNCSKLEWVVFGKNVVAVGSDSFKGTPSLKYVVAKNKYLSQPDNVQAFYYAEDYTCIEHTYGYKDKEPTCTEYGYSTCVICDKTAYLKALGHSGAVLEFADVSCTTDAYKIIECIRCGETSKVITEQSPGHISNGVSTIVPPTYMTPGYTVSTCITCNSPFIYDYNAKFTIIGDANCNGKIDHYDLAVMKSYLKNPADVTNISTNNADVNRDRVVDEKDALILEKYLLGIITELPKVTFACFNHASRTTHTVVEATCYSSGFVIEYCLGCGELTDEKYIEKLSHDVVVEYEIQPSCSVKGVIAGTCTLCDDYITTPIDTIPHKHKWFTIASQRGYEYSICETCKTFEGRPVDYSVFDALMGQIPEYYEIYYSNETIAQIQPIIYNYELSLTQEDVDANVSRLSKILPEVQYRVIDVPVVFIDDKNIGRDSYTPARIIVAYRGEDGKTHVEAIEYNGTAKIRGNSTGGMAKKPYNIKFSSQVDLFGMGASKKYSLLANYKDDTFIKNALTFELSDLFGLEYGCKYEIVDVYCNGVFGGAYMLTTAVEVGDDRVDIDEDYDYLFEIEKEGSNIMDPEGFYVKSPIFNIHFLVESPEDMSAASLSKLYTLISQIDYAILSGDWDLIQKYVDVDSVARYFILHDVLKELDIIWDSTRFYIEEEEIFDENGKVIDVLPRLHGGPAWDFDRCAFSTQDEVKGDGGGTAFSEQNYYDRNTEGCVIGDTSTGVWASVTWRNSDVNNHNDLIWFTALYKHSPDFVEHVCKTVIELNDEISLLYQDKIDEQGNLVQKNIIDSIVFDKDINESIKRNVTQWGVVDYFQLIENLREWFKKRNEWMQSYYSFKLDTLS